MQSVSSRIWIHVAVSIFYDDNHDTTGSSIWESRILYQMLSGPGSDDNEGLLHIPQNFSITGTSLSDCLVSCEGHSLWGESYHSAEVQSVYSTAPAPNF